MTICHFSYRLGLAELKFGPTTAAHLAIVAYGVAATDRATARARYAPPRRTARRRRDAAARAGTAAARRAPRRRRKPTLNRGCRWGAVVRATMSAPGPNLLHSGRRERALEHVSSRGGEARQLARPGARSTSSTRLRASCVAISSPVGRRKVPTFERARVAQRDARHAGAPSSCTWTMSSRSWVRSCSTVRATSIGRCCAV